MLDLRTTMMATAGAVGLTLGALAWLAAGRGDALADLQTRMEGLRPTGTTRSSPLSGALSGPPLFALSTGPGAVSDPVVSVLGLSRMPGRSAALLAIGGQAPAWLGLGEVRDGVWLKEVGSGRVTLDLPLGLRDLRLGETTGPAGTAPSPAVSQATLPGDQPPAGYRQPLPPASAPTGAEAAAGLPVTPPEVGV